LASTASPIPLSFSPATAPASARIFVRRTTSAKPADLSEARRIASFAAFLSPISARKAAASISRGA
jgi:hypothetical protein